MPPPAGSLTSQSVCPAAQNEGASRDLLLLDIALDSYFRLCVERMDKGALQGEPLCALRAATAGLSI